MSATAAPFGLTMKLKEEGSNPGTHTPRSRSSKVIPNQP